jgi:translation initiation factor IF-1
VKKNIKKTSNSNTHTPKKSFRESRKQDLIYFDDAVVIETLPGTQFKLKVELQNNNPENPKPPIQLIASLKTKLIKKKVLIIKGDRVTVEVNPTDMYFDEETKILKGLIIERN